MSPAKVAAAADAVERLASLVETLRETHGQTVKSAQQLIEAVKLAQQGLIDTSDIFVRAGLEIPEPTVSPLGKIADVSPSVAAREASQAAAVDPLTSFLRGSR
jgi:hypothetical protein